MYPLPIPLGRMPMSPGTLRLQSRPLAVSAAGVVGVLLIHALLVLPFVLDLSTPSKRRPDTVGSGATALVSAAEPEMTVVFIDELTPPENTAPKPPALASRRVTPPALEVVVLSPDPSPAVASETANSNDAQEDTVSADAAEHARLYGRYVGQLQARIERAWLRPRSEIGTPRFSCRARIRQDPRGAVLEVTLDHCSGTQRWQQSLLSAIRTASPLPAPPDASVYADILWLSFSSEAFEEGGSTQGFEPESRLADASDQRVLQSFQRFARGTQGDQTRGDKEGSNVIHLTIIGNPAGNSVQGLPLLQPSPALPPEGQPADVPPQ